VKDPRTGIDPDRSFLDRPFFAPTPSGIKERMRRAAGEHADLLAIVVMLVIAGWTMLEIWRL
jgi:hypothetical protein